MLKFISRSPYKAYGIGIRLRWLLTSKPVDGLGKDIKNFVDDISATSHSKRHYDSRTRKRCIVKVHASMAETFARGM